MQLLLIIDYICDWARDIYRPNVLRCLAGDNKDTRDFTPAYSTVSSQINGLHSRSNTALSLTTRTGPAIPTVIDLTLESESEDTVP